MSEYKLYININLQYIYIYIYIYIYTLNYNVHTVENERYNVYIIQSIRKNYREWQKDF